MLHVCNHLSGRRPHSHGRPGGRGKGRGRCSRSHGRPHCLDLPQGTSYAQAPVPCARPAGQSALGQCSLCENNCPLNAPACPKGEALAARVLGNRP